MSDEVKKISLELQGGGAFGAFGWGVLDRLLAENRLQIAAISGTSAGGVNAAVVADGYARGGGREGAREALRRFWRGPSCCAFTRSASRRQSWLEQHFAHLGRVSTMDPIPVHEAERLTGTDA